MRSLLQSCKDLLGSLRPALRATNAIMLGLLFSNHVMADFFDGPAANPGAPMFFSIYSVFPADNFQNNMETVGNGEFTAVGPYYGAEMVAGSSEFFSIINAANGVGLGFVVNVPEHPSLVYDVNGYPTAASLSSISEISLRQHVRNTMNHVLNNATANSSVAAWYVTPEELRPSVAAEMNYLRIVAEEVKSYDTLSRPVSIYNPNHYTSIELQTVVNQGLDTTMMGIYATDVSFDTRGARIADGINRIVSAATNTSTTPTAVFELSQNYDLEDLLYLRASLDFAPYSQAVKHVIRHDVYQGLIRGVEGVQVWSGCDCRSGLTNFSQQLAGYLSVAEDVNGSLGLNDVFLQGEVRTDFVASILSGPSTVTHNATTIDTVALADIAYGNERFLFLANSSNRPITLSVDGLPAGIGLSQIVDLFDNAPELTVNTGTGKMLLSMQPLEIVAFKIQNGALNSSVAVPEPAGCILIFIGMLGSSLSLGRFDWRGGKRMTQ